MVRRLVAVLFVAICLLSTASAFAVGREKDPPGPVDRVLRLIRHVVHFLPNPLDELGQPKP